MSRSEISILWLIKELRAGGAEQLLVEHASVLSDDLRVVTVHLGGADDVIADNLERRGVSVIGLSIDSEYDLRWARQLCRLVAEHEIRVVHAHSPYPAAIARLAFAGRRRPRFVYTEHNLWSEYKTLTRWANATTFSKNECAFAVSREVRNSMGHFARNRTRVLLHGIDLEALRREQHDARSARAELGLADDAKLVCTVANYRRKKDYPTLLRAASRVLEGQPDVTFVCIGDGPEASRIKRIAQDLQLGTSLRMLGFRGDARRFIAAADLFVLSSTREGLPVAVMEAMGLGVPVVATAAGGVPELVDDGVTGIVVPIGDSDGLARSIHELLHDPARRRTMSVAASHASTAFDIRRATQVLEETYRGLARSDAETESRRRSRDMMRR